MSSQRSSGEMALFSSDNYKSPQVGAVNGAEADKDPLSRNNIQQFDS